MEPVTPAEHQLAVAARDGRMCDLRGADDDSDSPDRWGEDRVVRAIYLRYLLVDQRLSVQLVGARIDGHLDCQHHRLPALGLHSCVIRGETNFGGATFTGRAWFNDSTFAGPAWFNDSTFADDTGFDGATFTWRAVFNGATFTGRAMFTATRFTDDTGFGGATFTDDTEFNDAIFAGPAWFFGTTFTGTGTTKFTGATFTGPAEFPRATFGPVVFSQATFTDDTGFNDAIFAGPASFFRATFTGTAEFGNTTFTDTAEFNKATFTATARFDRLRCHTLDWRRTRWSEDVSTVGLTAHTVWLDRAVFEKPVRVDFVTARVSATRLRAARLHLVVSGASIDFADVDLAAGSLVESVPVAVPPVRDDRKPGRVPGGGVWVDIPALRDSNGMSRCPRGMYVYQWLGLVRDVMRLDADLTTALTPGGRSSVASLARAHVAGVTVSGMDLRSCTLVEADGLTQLTIAADCVLSNYRDGLRWPYRFRTSRRIIFDEVVASGDAGAWSLSPGSRATAVDPESVRSVSGDVGSPVFDAPSRRQVSATYRGLRKALEDSKDEPGAADFYYGEMEMRRRSARYWSAEFWLLTAYWLVSGYGLRALRAVGALMAVIAVSGWCFTNSDWVRPIAPMPRTAATTPLIDPNSRMWPWLFSLQETIALFRPTGATGVTLVGFGTVVDVAVRLLGPALLALAILALRNRTKR